MRLLARTWNLAHGRTEPETDTIRLEEMVGLVAEGEPDIVCLQEIPVWALRLLARWSRMQAIGAVAMRPRAGFLGRWLTSLQPLRLRSALTGQANAILVHGRHGGVGPSATLELNDRKLRQDTARSLDLSRADRDHWARNRRVCQTLRVQLDTTSVVVANLHLTHFDERLASAELTKATAFVDQLTGPDTPCVVGGDLNIAGAGDTALGPLLQGGYTRPAKGIDHVVGRSMSLVRGPSPLDDTVRAHGDVLLSDHPIVEAEFELA